MFVMVCHWSTHSYFQHKNDLQPGFPLAGGFSGTSHLQLDRLHNWSSSETTKYLELSSSSSWVLYKCCVNLCAESEKLIKDTVCINGQERQGYNKPCTTYWSCRDCLRNKIMEGKRQGTCSWDSQGQLGPIWKRWSLVLRFS